MLDTDLGDLDDFEVFDDVADFVGVYHVNLDPVGHVLIGFPYLLCPCRPKIHIDDDTTWVIHRRTQ